MKWLVIVRSRHDYARDHIGYDVSMLSFSDRATAQFVADWLLRNTRDGYLRCQIVEDSPP